MLSDGETRFLGVSVGKTEFGVVGKQYLVVRSHLATVTLTILNGNVFRDRSIELFCIKPIKIY
jgi:hypothetical protein